MFDGLPDRKKKAKAVTKALSDYPTNKSHDRHFDTDDCEKMGLVIKRLEGDAAMQDLVLTVHHCYMNTMMNTNAYKIIENQNGVALCKNLALPVQAPNQRQAIEQMPPIGL